MSTVLTDEQVIIGLSERVRAKMKQAGISQRQLAKITGDPLMTINGVVHGQHMPGSGLLSRIAEALECTSDHLLYGSEKKSLRAS